MKTETNTYCAECHWDAPSGEIHTWLFCELHKLGHNRETIIANVLYTADALREQEPPQ